MMSFETLLDLMFCAVTVCIVFLVFGCVNSICVQIKL